MLAHTVKGRGCARRPSMAAVFEKQVDITHTVAASDAQAWALADRFRRRIVRLLYKRPMCTAEVVDAVADEGIEKARTTVRYHMEILREAGIIEVSKIVGVRGTMEKYYTTPVKLLRYDAPDDFAEAHSSDIDAAARKIGQMLGRLAPRAAGRIPAGDQSPEYEQFVLAEILNRAMTRALEARYGEAELAALPPVPPRSAKAKQGSPGAGRSKAKAKAGKAPAAARAS